MENVLYLYKVVNGEYEPFPNKIGNDDNVIYDFVYNAKRMGGAPTITCTYKHPMCLDDLWSENVIAEFRGDKFFIRKTPTSSYDNTESVYKHELTLVSERIVLENVYFFDVVSDNNGDYQSITNSTNIPFFGTVYELAKRLNYSLRYSWLQEVDENGNVTDGYYVVVDGYDESVKHLYTEGKLITAQDQFFLNVLQECYNTFEIPYYFDGKVIHIGFGGLGDEIREQDGSAFQYGIDHSLLSIKKQNTNNKVVNRITGVGSADNIPYYYPNETEKGQISLSFSEGSMISLEDVELDKHKLASSTEIDESVVFKTNSSDASGEVSNITYFNESDGYVDALEYQQTYPMVNPPQTWGNSTIYAKAIKYVNDKGLLTWNFNIRTKVKCTKDGYLTLSFRIYYAATVLGEFKNYYANHLQQDTKCYIVDDSSEELKEVKIEPILSETYVALYNITLGEVSLNDEKTLELRFDFRLDSTKCEYLKWDRLDDVYCALMCNVGKAFDVEPAYYWENSRKRSEDISDFGITLNETKANELKEDPQSFVGTSFKVVRDSYIYPQGNLMPYIYRDSGGTNRFYNALNDTYKDADGNYIYYPNPYVEGRPSEHIENFDDIKPTIKGMVGIDGQAFDSFIEFAFDENDNDETDENGKYIHPYFFAKLPKYNGEYGFNLFDHAIDEAEMTISMTSGSCGACEFVIGVDADSQKNLVQVDGNGKLLRDTDGNVRCGREGMPKEEAQDAQNDTMNNEVWVALKKDASTFGVVMPNVEHKYYPNVGDTFVILHIDLPKAYIEAAEKRLEDALLAYMQENNEEKFSFSMQMSRIFLAQNPIIRDSITENSKVLVSYNGKEYSLFISSYQYKVTSKDALPDVTIELKDELSIRKNAIENAVGQVKTELLGKMNSVNLISQGSTTFLRKDINDVAHGKITFEQGLKSNDKLELGKFVEGASGAGIWKDVYGNWHIESDFFNVRKKLSATSVEIKDSHHIGGEIMLTAASCTIDYVRVVQNEYGVNVYRCYFLKQDADGNTITNDWLVDDQAMCQFFNVTSVDSVKKRFYWRVVTGTSNDKEITPELIEFEDAIINTINYHYIDLALEGEDDVYKGSDAPRALDKVVQLGCRDNDDPSRQNAIVISGSGEGSPSIKQYVGINDFSLDNKLETQIKPDENILSGTTKFKNHDGNNKELKTLGKDIDTATNTANNAYGMAADAQVRVEDVENIMNNMVTGKSNLLLNSGFTGDYVTSELDGEMPLQGESQMFSPTLKYWSYNNATVTESSESMSGAEVSMDANGYIQQNLQTNVAENQDYVISFRGKGATAYISFGGVNIAVSMSNAWENFVFPMKTTTNGNLFKIEATNPCTLCDIQLERGNTASAWGRSPLDNKSDLARYEQLTYLENALKRNRTTIDGSIVTTGLINAGLIAMGNINDDGTTSQVTAGINGAYNKPTDVAFFAGGDLEKAIYTVAQYEDNPKHQPSEGELDNNMAKAVITHGGRAILNDIILRGYIYATGGVFNGKVIAESGDIGGFEIDKNSLRIGNFGEDQPINSRSAYISPYGAAFQTIYKSENGGTRMSSIAIGDRGLNVIQNSLPIQTGEIFSVIKDFSKEENNYRAAAMQVSNRAEDGGISFEALKGVAHFKGGLIEAVKLITTDGGTHHLSIYDGTSFAVLSTSTTQTTTILLPHLDEVKNFCGLGEFVCRLDIMNHFLSYNNEITLQMPNYTENEKGEITNGFIGYRGSGDSLKYAKNLQIKSCHSVQVWLTHINGHYFAMVQAL